MPKHGALKISGTTMRSEAVFYRVLYASAICVLAILAGMFVTILWNSIPSIKAFGFKFLYGRTWDPVANEFGTLPFVIGTLSTALLALLISIPFSLAISIFLGEYFKEGIASSFLIGIMELLAAIPSVIYGFWGLFFLVPIVRWVEASIGAPRHGVGVLAAALILSIMIIPYSAFLGREVISLVPSDIKEAAYSLGATRYEVIREVILPYARSGMFAGILLALGRALGETMAVTMVIGNSNFIPWSVFSPANTMASVIANEFTEATGSLYLSSLIEIGLLLFILTAILNLLGRYIIKKLV